MERRLEGSRFGLWLYDPAIFVQFRMCRRKTVSTGGSREWPGRRLGPLNICAKNLIPTRPSGETARWVIPGSRPFNSIFWPSSHWKKYRGLCKHDPKRLPSSCRSTDLALRPSPRYMQKLYQAGDD
jgi:hypothetical protein